MSFANYPWSSAGDIRRHFADRRERLQKQHQQTMVELNKDEDRELATFDQILKLLED